MDRFRDHRYPCPTPSSVSVSMRAPACGSARENGFAVEGTYHVVGGRGEYSDFYGILLGVTHE